MRPKRGREAPGALRRPTIGTLVFALLSAPIVAGAYAAELIPGPGAAALLPAEKAFAFSARALDAHTIEARFTVAPGYYLYRDKFQFDAAAPARVGAPDFPAGEVKQDKFFGRVEIYRGELLVRVPVIDGTAGASIAFSAESQGCAEIGVCYPPMVQRVAVELPQPGARPTGFIDARPAGKRWFN